LPDDTKQANANKTNTKNGLQYLSNDYCSRSFSSW